MHHWFEELNGNLAPKTLPSKLHRTSLEGKGEDTYCLFLGKLIWIHAQDEYLRSVLGEGWCPIKRVKQLVGASIMHFAIKTSWRLLLNFVMWCKLKSFVLTVPKAH